MDFKIAEIAGQTELLLGKIDKKLTEAEQRSGVELDFSLLDEVAASTDRKVKIVFVGQYSAGKSSIIKMLTGKENIAIGEGITTQESTSYHWNGLEIVDTPGIATGFRKDHDQIAKRAIAQADLLVFVITNEGFDSLIIENFKQLAYELPSEKNEYDNGMGKINEILLVVNKMERMGNTPENQELLLEDIHKAMGDVELPTVCFLSAQSYLDSLNETDADIKAALAGRSGYNSFVDELNSFVKAKGFIGQLVMPVQQMETALMDALQRLNGSIDDPNVAAADTMLRRMINTLRHTQRAGAREMEDIFSRSAAEIRSYGRTIADGIGTEERQPEESEIKQHLKDISRACQKEAEGKIEAIFQEANLEIEEMAQSTLAVGLEANISNPNVSEGTETLKMVSDTLKKLGPLAKQIDKDLLIKAGRLFNHKFRPWEATKLVKCMNKWLPVVGNVLDLIVEVADQKKAEEARAKLNEARRDAIAAFNNTADAFEQEGRRFIQEHFIGAIQDVINVRTKEMESLDSMKQHKSEYAQELQELIRECRVLQRKIRRDRESNESTTD